MSKLQGPIMALASGTLLLIVLGSLYTFGTITPYISAYLYYNGDETSSTTLSILFTSAIVLINIGQIISRSLQTKLSNRIICFMSIIMISSTVLITSFMKSLIGFIIFYGIMYGVAIGIGYLPPIKNAYLHLPHRKGLVGGVCMTGFGLGSIIFNYIIIYAINPNDQPIDPVTNKFPQSVANNLPFALRILAGCYFGAGMLAAFFIIPPKNRDSIFSESLMSEQNRISSDISNEKVKATSEESNFQVFMRKKGYFLSLHIACIIPFGMFVAFNYKDLAFQLNPQFKEKDHLITLIGTVGILTNGLFRSVWGILFDKYSYRTLCIIINIMLLVCCSTILFAVKSFVGYLFLIPSVYLCYGGMFALLPTQTVRVLGQKIGVKMFWLAFTGFSLSAVIQYLVRYFMIKNYGKDGYTYCIIIFGALEIVGLFMSVFVKYDLEIDKKPATEPKKYGEITN